MVESSAEKSGWIKQRFRVGKTYGLKINIQFLIISMEFNLCLILLICIFSNNILEFYWTIKNHQNYIIVSGLQMRKFF